MIVPLIHSGGTAQSDLVDGYCAAINSIRDAIKSVQENGPNGRDYYPLGRDVCKQAFAEHSARLQSLQAVVDDLEALAMAICDTVSA